MKKHHGGSLLGALLVCASTALVFSGCSKKKDEAQKETDTKPAPSASVDRLADGKRLEKSIADWTKRWNDFAPLPSCEKLLSGPDLELCTKTETALATLKDAVATKKPQDVVMQAAADLALAAEQANEKLRAVVMEKTAKEGGPATGSRPPPGGVQPPNPPATPHAAPGGSARPPKLAERIRSRDGGVPPPNPDNAVVEAYGRAARLALRYLSTYLQYGPLPTRQAAFSVFEKLAEKRPAWPGLLRSLREASLMEKEPNLSAKLKDMVTKLRALAPKPSRPVLPASASVGAPAAPPAPKPPAAPTAKPAAAPAAPAPAQAPAPTTPQ